MKPFRRVEATRKLHHQDSNLNSVHRSSLMVPELAGSSAEITFLNHFLIKRDIPHVACRITAVDQEGQRIESHLHSIREPKVYTLPLTGMVNQPVSSYIVEFYAPENLVIPFPAVMVNHRGLGFHNSLHSYNRILNDVFEDDEINTQQVVEASVDVKLSWDTDTFVVFTAGFQGCQGDLELELATETEVYVSSVGLDVPRLCSQEISLREVFPDIPSGRTGILKVRQPPQFMFYGRMMMGQRHNSGAFTANHSYYDSSRVEEYWDDARESFRLYPFFAEFRNTIRMYPIMSPGRLEVVVRFYDHDGVLLAKALAGEVESPSHTFLDASIDALLEAEGIRRSEVATFELLCRPVSGRTPTRIAHQLVHGGDNLQSSFAVGLHNPNEWNPTGKLGLAWGQTMAGGDVDSWLGIVCDGADGDSQVEIVFYGPEGEIARRHWDLPRKGSVVVNVGKELAEDLEDLSTETPTYIWYVARGNDSKLSAFTVNRHRETGHCSGEHSF